MSQHVAEMIAPAWPPMMPECVPQAQEHRSEANHLPNDHRSLIPEADTRPVVGPAPQEPIPTIPVLSATSTPLRTSARHPAPALLQVAVYA